MHVIIRFARQGMTRDLANQFRDHFTARLEQEGVPGVVSVVENGSFEIVLDREPKLRVAVTVADLIKLASLKLAADLPGAGPRTPGVEALFRQEYLKGASGTVGDVSENPGIIEAARRAAEELCSRTGTPTSLSPGEIALFVSLLQEHDRRRVDQSLDRVHAHLSPQGRRVAAVLFGDAVSDVEVDREVAFLHRQVVLETQTVRDNS